MATRLGAGLRSTTDNDVELVFRSERKGHDLGHGVMSTTDAVGEGYGGRR
jgi:hypothetical protein